MDGVATSSTRTIHTPLATLKQTAPAKESSKKKDIAANTNPNSYSMIASAASDESAMAVQIQKSPMSVCVDAANLWQTYTGGLVTKADNCGTSIDHAVQAVGINTDTFSGQKKTYWIVRNSWTPQWGEQGYIYVEYGQNNCGVTSQATIVQLSS